MLWVVFWRSSNGRQSGGAGNHPRQSLNDEAYRIFLRNSRLPHMFEGDTKAIMASCHLAENRILELFERYGQETVLATFQEVIDSTAVRARSLFLDLIPEAE